MDTAKAKITVTLDRDLLDKVRAGVAAGQARSVSAFVEHAVQSQLAAEADFDELITGMLASTGGAPSEKERAAAAHLLSGSIA